MNPIESKDPKAPHRVLIIAEQKMILVDDKDQTAGAPEEYRVLQPLTDQDITEFYNKLENLLGEYGFQVDHYGEKEAMIRRLTTGKAKSEYE